MASLTEVTLQLIVKKLDEILKWGGKSVDVFNLPSGAGKLEKLIPKRIASAKDKDWEPFIVMAIALNLL